MQVGRALSEAWQSPDMPRPPRIGLGGWLRAVRRGLPLGLLVFGGLVVLLLVRLIERPLCGLHRPVTPYITQCVCRGAFVLLGIRYQTVGQPMSGPGAVVANHASWLDVLALNARKRIYFVAKSEVASWPGIGWLARATGTVFIKRERREASSQIDVFRDRLAVGHKLLFFPEGTSTDGLRVLPFKPTLFAAFLDPALVGTLQLQPVTLVYKAPEGEEPRFYGWWGDMELAPHLLATLCAKRQGSVTVVYHAPAAANDFADRKALARQMEKAVRQGLTDHGLVEAV